MGILFLLAIVVLIIIIMMLVGLVMIFSSDKDTSKKGGKYLLYGFLILLTMVLIGYAICSNLNFGGMH
jgi:cell division protein FtsW (lipid II flippase)